MFPYFDRFDIVEAYYLIEVYYNVGGWLHERSSNVRRGVARGFIGEATHVQLARIAFNPRSNLSYDTLTDNGKAIYDRLVELYGFTS